MLDFTKIIYEYISKVLQNTNSIHTHDIVLIYIHYSGKKKVFAMY